MNSVIAEQELRDVVGPYALTSHHDAHATGTPSPKPARIESIGATIDIIAGADAENLNGIPGNVERARGLDQAHKRWVVGPHAAVDQSHAVDASPCRKVGGRGRSRHRHLPSRELPVTPKPGMMWCAEIHAPGRAPNQTRVLPAASSLSQTGCRRLLPLASLQAAHCHTCVGEASERTDASDQAATDWQGRCPVLCRCRSQPTGWGEAPVPSPIAMMPPVEVPVIRSKWSVMLTRKSCSKYARTAAENSPRIPPPSSARMRNSPSHWGNCSCFHHLPPFLLLVVLSHTFADWES